MLSEILFYLVAVPEYRIFGLCGQVRFSLHMHLGFPHFQFKADCIGQRDPVAIVLSLVNV
jgi:hypothetical protein